MHGVRGRPDRRPAAALWLVYDRCLALDAPLVVGYMRVLPFVPCTFDGIWAMASLLHLPRVELAEALAESRRVLKPGGLMFACVKAGTGEGVDRLGRFHCYYDNVSFAQVWTSAGFSLLQMSSSDEVRTNEAGDEMLTWLSALAVAPR